MGIAKVVSRMFPYVVRSAVGSYSGKLSNADQQRLVEALDLEDPTADHCIRECSVGLGNGYLRPGFEVHAFDR